MENPQTSLAQISPQKQCCLLFITLINTRNYPLQLCGRHKGPQSLQSPRLYQQTGNSDPAECRYPRRPPLNLPSEEGDTTLGTHRLVGNMRKEILSSSSASMRFLRRVLLSMGQNKLLTQVHRGEHPCVGILEVLRHLSHLYDNTIPPHCTNYRYRS